MIQRVHIRFSLIREVSLPAVRILLFLACLAVPATGCREAAKEGDAVLARVGGLEFTVREAAALLRRLGGPVEEKVVVREAEAWVDFTIMALEAAADPGLRRVDVDPVARQRLGTRILDRWAKAEMAATGETEIEFMARVREEARVRVSGLAPSLLRTVIVDGPSMGDPSGERSVLARFEGGSYTVAEAMEYMASREPGFLFRATRAESPVLLDLVRTMAQVEALLVRARAAGYEALPGEEARIRNEVLTDLQKALENLGLRGADLYEADAPQGILPEAVMEALTSAHPRQRSIHFRPFSWPLESRHRAFIDLDVLPRVLEEVDSPR